jgi:hypothetical protein
MLSGGLSFRDWCAINHRDFYDEEARDEYDAAVGRWTGMDALGASVGIATTDILGACFSAVSMLLGGHPVTGGSIEGTLEEEVVTPAKKLAEDIGNAVASSFSPLVYGALALLGLVVVLKVK